jgi:two-component system, NarL family, response regulator LiaR
MTAKEKQIRILVADDHAVVRSGLGALLMANEDFMLVGEANNGEEAVRLCERLQPDVVLMDLMMPVMDGVTATKIIREKWNGVNVIALTSFKEKEMVEGALKAGAISYLLKTVTAGELENAIRSAMVGESRLSPEATQVLVQRIKEPAPLSVKFTERETDILKLMVEGIPNIEIANRIFVSESTVKFHVSNILGKLGCTSRTEAVAIALKNNLVK